MDRGKGEIISITRKCAPRAAFHCVQALSEVIGSH